MKRKDLLTFQDSLTYVFLGKARRFFREVQEEKARRHSPECRVVTLFPEGTRRGQVLFSYIIGGFFLQSDASFPNKHTNIWQSFQMVATFVELGYEVDVIHWTNHHFVPTKSYSIFVDVRNNMERLTPLLHPDCIKIMHLDTAHIVFHNAAEATRLLQLQQRRGVTLKARRFEMPNLGIEHAHCATTTGNDFVVDTFAYAQKPIYKLPSPCAILMDQPQKNWEHCKKYFLWFSSGGLVHKGLDLALEAFTALPECHLMICAPIEQEKDFVSAYYQELYETSNIHAVGWVDIESQQFREIANACAAMIHLSCSEGGAPSIKTCMHAGLIPIVSYESGVDVQDFGLTLTDCSISHVRAVITQVSQMSQYELEEMSRRAWKFARENYTRENFAKEYREVILKINDAYGGKA
ncbi:MAG: hypothetical protein NPIRA01_23380 [Nitrospirales bacterium]|nr:MAG: hypothetical protein NPIRA01_23380 [Nitrospirales bacterium]